ncbi:GNAT family N-acetyltransferase [Caballeronia glathei]|jgi:GNAT superfamily N-acetyltransferase|uniref:GCN5 family acetyltransferase n=1 Tax=Caballeronia glathei TaxID=60547 RepID=A0A069PT03_9BURK|nr:MULTISPECIES: GNAT family N-acetyltransferase [Burkholderiaceae]KDR43705.1 GCN5 family acetyltransferase [Caballeronia glathei]TCK43640.1 acetyltransferase (GNAT) family protein [Paraburkholderia sp. BL8N3]
MRPATQRATPVPIARKRHGDCHVELRRFDPAHDSFDELTDMLHRSFARLGSMGLNCTCVDQPATVTRERALRGACYIALCGGRIVATMTLYSRDPDSCCELYRRDGVASIGQFAVDPAYQDRGIGKLMLALADHWAAIRGYAELALDTPQPAAHLIAFYRRQGFRIAAFFRRPGKRYDSAILSRPPKADRAFATWSRRIEAHHADMARAA